jgi:hypothetical protein
MNCGSHPIGNEFLRLSFGQMWPAIIGDRWTWTNHVVKSLGFPFFHAEVVYVYIIYVKFPILPSFYLSQSFAQVPHHGHKFQEYLDNHGKSMCVKESFGCGGRFHWVMDKWGGDVSLGVFFMGNQFW